MADLVQNDTGVNLIVTCYDQDGNVIDLTSAVGISLQFYINSFPPTQTRTMTVIGEPTQGIVQYTFSTYVDDYGNTQFDLQSPGTLRFRVSITFPSTVVITSWGSGEISLHESLLT